MYTYMCVYIHTVNEIIKYSVPGPEYSVTGLCTVPQGIIEYSTGRSIKYVLLASCRKKFLNSPSAW